MTTARPALRIIHVAALGPSPKGALPGPLNVALKQAAELQERGHSVEILTTRPRTQNEARSGLTWIAIRQFRYFMFPLMRRSGINSPTLLIVLARQLRRASVVHIHAGRDLVSLPSMLLCCLSRTPYVTQTHGMILKSRHPAKRLLDALVTVPLLARARTSYALQATERHDLLHLGLRASGIRILANGYAADNLPEWRPALPPIVLFVARLHPEKRVMDFARMAASLIDSGIDARFEVIGSDQGDLPSLEAFRASTPLAGRLSYLGERSHDEVLAALARATVYVLPSDYDPFPMSLVEALAVGTPSVCTAACGIAGLLRASGAGVIADPDPRGLAKAVSKLLSDRTLQQNLSMSGKRLVAGPLSIESTVGQLERDYRLLARTS